MKTSWKIFRSVDAKTLKIQVDLRCLGQQL